MEQNFHPGMKATSGKYGSTRMPNGAKFIPHILTGGTIFARHYSRPQKHCRK